VVYLQGEVAPAENASITVPELDGPFCFLGYITPIETKVTGECAHALVGLAKVLGESGGEAPWSDGR